MKHPEILIPIHALPFVSSNGPGHIHYWTLPRTRSYDEACTEGPVYGSIFLDFMAANPFWEGSGLLENILAAMDRADESDPRGYADGFPAQIRTGEPTMSLVTMQNGTPFASTLAIAEGTGNQHKNVMELVRSYASDLETFGGVAFQTRPFETARGHANAGGDAEGPSQARRAACSGWVHIEVCRVVIAYGLGPALLPK